MSLQFNNLAISAAAGAGKTYQLVHRYIGLLACGVAPEKVIALTFSRKAAGEIFDRIIDELAKASMDHTAAGELSRGLAQSNLSSAVFTLDRKQFTGLLRKVVDASHLLRIGTLDGFLVSVIQAFPFEFGLGSELAILDGYSAGAARQEALRLVFDRLAGSDNDAARSFLEHFRLATYGQEVKGFSETLKAFIEQYHGILLEANQPELWGNPTRIWPRGCPWLSSLEYPDLAATRFQDYLAASELPETMVGKSQEFFSVLPRFNPVADWDKVKYFYLKLASVQADLPGGSAILNLNRRKVVLDRQACQDADRIFAYITAQSLDSRLRGTRGVYQILAAYEKCYRQQIRQSGRLTFSDIAFLLGRRDLGEGSTAPRLLSSAVDQVDRLYLDYRLDGHFDHWLLDEFQDTSTLQWQAMANLIDEVMQDSGGGRSFFYVGDVKQAIYGWRGGDPALFQWVAHQYDGQISHLPLSCSYRSSQPVVNLVNQVFDQIQEHGLELDSRIWDRWNCSWQRHLTARTEAPGFAAVYSFAHEKRGSDRDPEEVRFQALVEIVRQVDPLSRGCSAAALVRTNEQGRRLTAYLRRAGVPVRFVGKFGILDTPLNAALASLVKIAEHPGDRYAWLHLQMTPLRHALPATETPPSSLVKRLLTTMIEQGVAGLLREWTEKSDLMITGFERTRLKSLLNAACEFDAQGGGAVIDFINYLAEYQVEDPAALKTVQVMTIHQAKGLQFDLVLLPCLDRNQGIDRVGLSGLHIARSEEAGRYPRWVLDLPRREVAMTDPVLTGVLDDIRVERAYEELCNLYVAMTRAKYGLYVFRTEPGPSSQAVYPSSVVVAGIGENPTVKYLKLGPVESREIYANGDPAWFDQFSPPAEEPPAKPLEFAFNMEPGLVAGRRRYRRETPSGSEELQTGRAAWLFNRQTGRFAQFGIALHAFVSRIKWYHAELDLTAIFESVMRELELDRHIARQAFEQLTMALARPAVQQALARPRGQEGEIFEAWLERRFELVLQETWISGCFDRVVVKYGSDRMARQAVITDFKTSVVDSRQDLERALRGYKPQLAVYRQALARILALDQRMIKTQLIFTRGGEVVNCH